MLPPPLWPLRTIKTRTYPPWTGPHLTSHLTVTAHAEVMGQGHLSLVHQPARQMQEIALGDADAEGIMSVDALLRAIL